MGSSTIISSSTGSSSSSSIRVVVLVHVLYHRSGTAIGVLVVWIGSTTSSKSVLLLEVELLVFSTCTSICTCILTGTSGYMIVPAGEIRLHMSESLPLDGYPISRFPNKVRKSQSAHMLGLRLGTGSAQPDNNRATGARAHGRLAEHHDARSRCHRDAFGSSHLCAGCVRAPLPRLCVCRRLARPGAARGAL